MDEAEKTKTVEKPQKNKMKSKKLLIWLLSLAAAATVAVAVTEISIKYMVKESERRHVGYYRDIWWADCYKKLKKMDKDVYAIGMQSAKDLYQYNVYHNIQLTTEEIEIAQAASDAARPFTGYITTAPADYEEALKYYRKAAQKERREITAWNLLFWAAGGLLGAGLIGVPTALITNRIVNRKRMVRGT